jgi:2-dehydropantoate 2-reductase
MQRLLFGEFDGRRSKRVEDFYRICVAGGINAEISPDIRREIWQKFVFLVALSGATTSMRMALGPIRENPRTRQFFLDLMKEVVAVGRARGIALPADYAEQRMNFADGLPRDMIASMYHDLQQGKPLELAWLSGAVVDIGAAVGVPTPMNRAVRDVLLLHAHGRACG